ncbi:MAG: PilZ domain-containing protein [Candidatus Korobacteraceae bacterium]
MSTSLSPAGAAPQVAERSASEVASPDFRGSMDAVQSSTRLDRRIPVQLHLQIEGDDSRGKHFSVPATTIDISRVGARLSPLSQPVLANAIVDVSYEGQRARCRVIWMGNSPEERGQVGIRCMDESRVPWSSLAKSRLAKGDAPAAGVSAGAGRSSPVEPSRREAWTEQERRRAPRYKCDVLARVGQSGHPYATSARVTDISRNGGYMETMSPFPMGARVQITLETPQGNILLSGSIRTFHPAMGNGVAFASMDAETERLLNAFLDTLEPAPVAYPHGIAQPAESLLQTGSEDFEATNIVLHPQVEALIELLEAKSLLTRGELLEHLRRR